MGAPYFAYTWTDAPELCRCSHVAELYGTGYCLQSRGPTGGAQIEGFAHAYSTRIWTKDSEANGIFVYYKPFKNPYVAGSPVWNPPITMTILSQTKFMANWCAQTGKGTELDWSQFFYQVTARQTINSTPMSNLFSTYRKACTGNVNSNCTYSHKISWENLRASAQSYWASNSIYNKFRDLGIATGVNY
jgi:hypothetical protein